MLGAKYQWARGAGLLLSRTQRGPTRHRDRRRGVDAASASARRRAAGASSPRRAPAVRELLGDAPRRSDLLIEHLHKIQDRFGHLSARRTWRRWPQEMQLAQTEVFEVATFYHHFDVVKEGDDRAAAR